MGRRPLHLQSGSRHPAGHAHSPRRARAGAGHRSADLKRLAVVLFNLGGPDGPKSVRPFLFNLFNDPAIIGLPGIARTPLAALISTTRAKAARANYAVMGGGSPLLGETQAQAVSLEAALSEQLPGVEARCFVAMRYWTPLTQDAAREVEDFGPDEIVLLPLYPQFSTTTSGSSLKAWRAAYKGPGRSRTICCYPEAEGFVDGYVQAILRTWEDAGRPSVKLLLSAHGLPEKVIAAGDPYQAQVEATAGAITARLPGRWEVEVCYQSRVGPLKWIGPATDEVIRRAGADGRGLLVAPIAFVSEHVETLVELDHEYGHLARESGCPVYLRAPAVGVAQTFIDSLAGAVVAALPRDGVADAGGGRWCPRRWGRCPSEKAVSP
ncbi:MAG: ferrochelatase [Proteobacteria bacterium]|nr:ferrochelatase [Pseudomonadota bacterium]